MPARPLYLLALFMLISPAIGATDSQVKITKHPNHLDVTIGGQPFTSYWFGPRDDRPYVRPFFYPVLAAGQVPMTSDQFTAGGDHPHHQSFYVAQGDVNGADHWALDGPKGADTPKQRHLDFSKITDDSFTEDLEWESKDHQPMLKETRTAHFFALPDGSRGVDLTSSFSPIDGPVTFGDTKEAGLCAVRVTHAISDHHPVLTNSEGKTGEKNVWGKPADWCDLSGKIDGKPCGVAIFDHPSNPRHPATWHAREYGLMTPNIFGLHDFSKKNSRHAGDFKIEKGQTVTFRHRVIFHPGDAKEAKLDEKYREYAK